MQTGIRRPTMSEAALQRAVEECAGVLGWHCFHVINSHRTVTARGYPDLTLARGGRVIFAELKTGRRGLTPEQEEWLSALRRCPGVEVYEWREEDWLSGRVEEVLR
jgi:hypothetical protein